MSENPIGEAGPRTRARGLPNQGVYGMINQEARRNKRRASLQGANEAGEEGLPIGAAEERIGSILGMRHQAEDRAGLVEDAGDRMRRAVEIFCLRHLAIRSAIAEG